MLPKGADITTQDDSGDTPFCTHFRFHDDFKRESFVSMVKEFARLSIENLPICQYDVSLIQTKQNLQELFKNCKNELLTMKSIKFCGSLSYCSLLKSLKNIKKLASLFKNEIVKKFQEMIYKEFLTKQSKQETSP